MVNWHHVVKNDKRKLLSHSLDHNTATAQRGKRYGSLPIVLEIKISQCNGYISHPKIFAHYFYFVVFCYHYKSYTYSHIYISLKVSYKQQFHQSYRYDSDMTLTNIGKRITWIKQKEKLQNIREETASTLWYILYLNLTKKVKVYCTQLLTCS